MDELESFIGKQVTEISSDILTSFESIGVKAAVLEYKYKNCGVRYPSASLKLADIDYDNVILFDDLFNFDKIFIFWHFKGTVTDLEIFDITSDRDLLKKDYDLILSKIMDGEASLIRAGDTRLLAAERLNEEVFLNDRKVNMRVFVLKKYYLQKILNELKLY
ncbi:hypothetical protein [Methanobrevibacter sp.]|uniref:hypothetical protein n=1 Tax=Methanobrevibacter sp. TaxID=66852 RepID=UPI00388F4F9E